MVSELKASKRKMRIYLILMFFLLIIIFIIGLFWLTNAPAQSVGLTLAFAAGLSMIVLPCTLPLVFVIVPLSMGKTYKKGLFMAILFGLGLIITLTIYGIVIAIMGQMLGLQQVAQIMYLFAGVISLIFGLTELRLLSFEMPAYRRMPTFIQKQPEYIKAFLLGLLLGNAGIGCPNPATYVILTWIAASGSILYGAGLQFANGIGRVIPLIALSILGILGVNATQSLMRKREAIHKITGFGLILVAAIIIVWAVYGHFWFLNTPVHKVWTRTFGSFGSGIAEYECCIEPPCMMCSEGKWIWEENTCLCRIALENGEMDKVCPECKQGLEEGKGVYDIAEKTQYPAFTLLAALIVIPVLWYIWKKPFSKKENEVG